MRALSSWGVQADGKGWGIKGRAYEKRRKNRNERHRAKQNPACQPGYGRYRGWLT